MSVVTVDGFEPEKEMVELEDGSKVVAFDYQIDPPGTANFLVEQYGLQTEGEEDPDQVGILWTDYDCGGWKFAVLLASDEVEPFSAKAKEAGYRIVSVEEVTEPTMFGDGHCGAVAICKHPEGWILG